MHAPSTARPGVLRQRHSLHAATANGGGLEHHVQPIELRMGGQPTPSCRVDPSHLLLVDHLERVPERRAALLLHLDDHDAVTASQDEIELVAAGSRVCLEQSIAAEAIVTK